MECDTNSSLKIPYNSEAFDMISVITFEEKMTVH